MVGERRSRHGGDPRPKRSGRARGAHLELGRRGEELAAGWYLDRGYVLLERNWRCPQGELDLVLRRGRTIVFCEVKTRSSQRFGSPFEAVDRRRIGRLRAAAGQYLRQAGRGTPAVRFDVAGVIGGVVEVRQGVF